MSEKTKQTVTDIIYKANREYSKRGPCNNNTKVYVGYHALLNKHILAVEISGSPPMIYFMGQLNIETKEKLIDYAMSLVEHSHGKLIVYPEFKK